MALQRFAPLTGWDFVVCAFLSTVVSAYGLAPSLALRRLSIRIRHGIRKHRLRLTPQRTVIRPTQRQMKLLVVGTFAFAGAVGVQQALLASSPAPSPSHATSVSFEVPSPSPLSARERVGLDPVRTDVSVREEAGATQTHEAGWSWLVDLLFLKDRPPA
jgi:hypothetical protein